MLKVDFRRMFTTPLFYIMLGISLVVPILILVMTTMMTPLDSTIIHIISCLAGSIMFAFSLGALSNILLKKNNILLYLLPKPPIIN